MVSWPSYTARPEDLARELGVDPKGLRAWLRREFPRSTVDHGQPWHVTEDQVKAARRRFRPSGGSTGRDRSPAELQALLDEADITVHQGVLETHLQAQGSTDLARRSEAAARYRPENVKLLLVAEAPPAASDRYFYFPEVSSQDSLFRYVVKGLYGVTPARSEKAEWLKRLASDGVYLIDLSEQPEGVNNLSREVPRLIDRCRTLRPQAVIIIKARVYDAAFAALRKAGLPVIDRRIPFPGSGQQRRFEEEFAAALLSGGWKA